MLLPNVVSPCPQPPLPEAPQVAAPSRDQNPPLSARLRPVFRPAPQTASPALLRRALGQAALASPALPVMALCSHVSPAAGGVLRGPSLLLPPPHLTSLLGHGASCGFITNLHACEWWLPRAAVGPPALCTEPPCWVVGLGFLSE